MGGKLVAFEGTDGSGKKTQTELLVSYLTKEGEAHESVDFPRYGQSLFGDIAGEMLRGDFGPIKDVPAKLAALPYACDRWHMKDTFLSWLASGKIVISNRYTASSAVYQAAKLPKEKQQEFIDWVYRLEQQEIGLPKEDLVIYFHMPVDLAQQLINKRGDTKDMYEKDVQLLKTVESLYMELCNRPNWKKISCSRENSIKTSEEIHKEVLDVLHKNGVL